MPVKKCRQMRGDGLFPSPRFRLWDVDDAALKVDMLATDTENLHVSHRGFKPDHDEGVHLGVLVTLRDVKKAFDLVHREIDDPSPLFFIPFNGRWFLIDPAPFQRLGEEMGEGGKLSVNGANFCPLA